MTKTVLPAASNIAPITRPGQVHYPAYYLGRPAGWYLSVYSRGKAHRSDQLARARTIARPLTSATPA